MTIQIPSQGTPVDAKLLSNIVTELNRVSGSLSNSSKRSKVKSPGSAGTNRDMLTSELGFYGTYVNISRSNVVINGSDTFSVDISGMFSLTPVAVATPVHQEAGTNPPELFVMLTDVTASRISGKIVYKTAGTINIRINVLAMGVPASVA